jgi:hypothetical protein
MDINESVVECATVNIWHAYLPLASSQDDVATNALSLDDDTRLFVDHAVVAFIKFRSQSCLTPYQYAQQQKKRK